jgi:hypothetical protein
MQKEKNMKNNSAEKQNKKAVVDAPSVGAYLWLVGVFAIVYAVIYIALLLRVHFLTDAAASISKSAADMLFAFALLMLMSALYLYVVFSRKELLNNLKEPSALMCIFALVVVANIFLSYLNSYAMFVGLAALLALPFSKKRDAFVLNIFACLISTFALIYETDLGHYESIAFSIIAGLVGGTIGAYSFPMAMTRTTSVLRSFLTGACTIAVYMVLLCAYTLGIETFNANIMYIGISVAAQLLLASTLVPVIESIFNITTDYRLVELTNHKAPLIRRLIVEAPGTFNHSLAVANFAEICANAIGEDPFLARACAYYHDIGKLNNATYFTENQAGYNPHDELLPEVSAEIIRQHTEDGYDLCKEHRIPEEIARVTIEHHGTLPIMYFYNKAKTLTDGDVDIDEYCYHGDIPKGKIAAIIMICDSAEAAIRAMDNPDGERVDKLLRSMIDERIKLGQFDDCAITMRDLTTLREAIVGSYSGLFHKRIKYNLKRGGSND